ncbi:MAG: translocation/assembly module TamB domain-containing protein [Deltaproteobacteria bacterium]|nr:translocation/assembly module TamB domain-containing protein [Deltaproteobacteria bacterium]
MATEDPKNIKKATEPGMSVVAQDAKTTTVPAMSDDVLGGGRADSGVSEPSEPNAVIGPVTKRRKKTAPYLEKSESEIVLDDLSPPPEGKPTKPRKSLPRRILKGVLWTFGILLLLVGLAIGFFHTGPGKSVARGIVEGALAKKYDGEVTLGRIDYALGGDVELFDLDIKEKGGKTVLHLSHALVDLDWGSLLSKPLTIEKLLVEGLALDLVAFPDGTNNLRRMQKEPTKLPEQIVVQALDVHDVKVRIERPDGSVLALTDVVVAGRLAMDQPAGKVDVALTKLGATLDLTRGEALHLVLPLSATLTAKVDNGTVDVALEPAATEASLTLKGRATQVPVAIGKLVAHLDPKTQFATMDFAGLAAGPLSLAKVHAEGHLPPAGEIKVGPGEHLLELVGAKLDKAGINTLLGKEVLASDVAFDASVKGPAERMVIAGQVATAGGNLGLSGTADVSDLLKPVIHLELTGDKIDTTLLLASPTRPDLQTGFKAVLDLVGLPPAHKAKLHVEVGKTTVKGRSLDSVTIDASTEGNLVTLDGLVLEAFGQTATVYGNFDRGTREFAATVRMTSAIGDAIQKARDAGVLLAALPPVSGDIDVDLGVSGRLKPPPAPGAEAPAGVEPVPASAPSLLVNGRLDLSRVPLETAKLTGHIKGKDIKAAGRDVGKMDIDLDLTLPEGPNPQPKGTVRAQLGQIDTGTMKIDSVDLSVLLDGLVQDFDLKVRDAAQDLAVDLHTKSVLDLEKRHVDVTVSKLDAKRGSFQTSLKDPVTIGIDQPLGADGKPSGQQQIHLPSMTLNLVGGTLGLGLQAQLSKDEANPGANKLDVINLVLDVDNLDLGRLAALAKRSTRGLSGKLGGTLHVQGTPQNPTVETLLTLRGRMKQGAPFTAKVDMNLRDKNLDLRLGLTDRGAKKPLLTFDLMAPIHLPDHPGDKAGLAPGGRVSIKANLPETTLGRLLALSPNPAPPIVDPDGKVAFDLDIHGSTARPTGAWNLSLDGGFLRRKGYEQAPARQKVTVQGSLRPDGRSTALASTLSLWLDSAARPFLEHETTASFDRSPLLPNPLAKPWTLAMRVPNGIDLAAINGLGLASKALAGKLGFDLALAGQGDDVRGQIDLTGNDLVVGTAPPAKFDGHLTITDADTRLTQNVAVAGLDVLAVDARLALPGKGLRRLAKDRARLMATPLSGEVRLVEHALSELRTALSSVAKLPELPGKTGGALVLGGTIATPTAKGAFAWDGFDTVAGTPGRVAFEVDATAERAEGGLALGAAREITIRGGVARQDLAKPKDPNATPAPLPIDLAMRADAVDLLRVMPALLTAGRPLELKGTLDWKMDGRVVSSRDPAKPGLLPGSAVTGDLVIRDLDINVPDTDRHLRDGKVVLQSTPTGLELKAIHLREEDPQRKDRTVDVSGKVAWTDLKPTDAALRVMLKDWLVLGLGFDTPEAELDLDLDVAVTKLGDPIKQVDVTVKSMDLDSPERFIRAHYPQFPAYDDVVYVDRDRPSGVLPPGKAPMLPPTDHALPPAPDLTLPPAPVTGFDVHLHIPEPIRVSAGNIPIDIKLKGDMDVAIVGKQVNLHGRIDVLEGLLGAMGREFRLKKGAITADGGLETAKAALEFAVLPSDLALRDIAVGHRDPLATISVNFTPQAGLKTVFGGVSGPYLLDMATFLNTGRARIWGLPDVPASETVRFGNVDQGLVLTFIQTNLRNLIFMDRANGWSESMERPEDYGKIQFFDMQRFLPGSRIWLEAQPVTIGQNRMELGYDWLLHKGPRSMLGFGPHLGLDLKAGLALTFDWASEN